MVYLGKKILNTPEIKPVESSNSGDFIVTLFRGKTERAVTFPIVTTFEGVASVKTAFIRSNGLRYQFGIISIAKKDVPATKDLSSGKVKDMNKELAVQIPDTNLRSLFVNIASNIMDIENSDLADMFDKPKIVLISHVMAF